MSWRISTVADETGVSAVTLRAWERRYGFPTPERTGGNYRTYSDDEVVKLRRVVALMGHGLSVSEAIARVEGEVKKPLDAQALVDRFFSAALVLDEAELEDVLQIVVRDLPAERACDDVLLPILRAMVDHLDVAREHMASRTVRNALVQLAAFGKRRSKRGPIVLACPEGEEHEGGILGAAVHLKLRGERVVILGANTPTSALAVACKQLKPAALCLSLIQPRPPAQARALLEEVVKHCKVPRVLVGGAFARETLKQVFAAGADYVADADEVVRKIEERK